MTKTNETTDIAAIEILLVEDNEADVILTREAFRDAKLLVHLNAVENGEECMAYLRKRGRYNNATTPDIILLDLNMPIMDGREVLAEIVKDENLRHLPVVILTTSNAKEDIVAMYDLRCSSYITKPVDFEQFYRVVTKFCEYWFTIVKLPPKS